MPSDRAALGAFLRSRRDGLTPAQAGITAFPGPRRVPGMRREELALAAGLSPDYYSRVEQGRQRNISREVLGALARALRLDDVERDHLFDLAAPSSVIFGFRHEVRQVADPRLLRMMTALDHLPVILLGRRAEILAHNALLRSVLGSTLEPGTSLVRFMFFDPVARERIVNWEVFATAMISTLRREAGRRPDDRALLALINELRAADSDAARWWDDHTVRDYASAPKLISHPSAGPLSFDIEVVGVPHDSDQTLIVYTAEPQSATARVLPILASWAADAAAMSP